MAITLNVKDGQDIADWSISGSDVTASAVDIGTAAADRIVAIAFGIERGQPIDDVLIDGVSVGSQIIKDDGFGAVTSSCVAWREVTSGTTCDIEIQMSASGLVAPRGQVYTLTGAEETAYDTDSDAKNGADASCSLDIPADGAAIAALFDRTGSNKTWTGLTEDYDDSSNRTMSAASDSGMSSETGRTITATPSNNNGVLTCVSFEEAASSGTDIAVDTAAISINPQQASISLDVDVAGNVEQLTISTLQASISLDTDIAANVEQLSINPQQATISFDTDVAGNVAQLSINPQVATIGYDVNITGNVAQLEITTPQATVTYTPGSDVDINVDLVQLNINPLPAAITYDVDVQGEVEQLSINPQQATISYDQNIDSLTAEMIITPLQATVSLGVNVQQSAPVALSITPQQAAIIVDTNVNASVAQLEITTHQATVTLVNQDVDVDVATAQLVFTTFTASITSTTVDLFPRENRMRAIVAANTHTHRVHKIPPHTAVVDEEVHTYSGVIGS